MRFRNLLNDRPGATPAEIQADATRLFPKLVATSPFHYWRVGDPIPRDGRRVLIGVAATYATHELEFLDALGGALSADTRCSIRVDVFNTMDCPSQRDFAKYFPGLEQVLVTPVAGTWRNGSMERAECGPAAIRLLTDMFEIDF